MIIFDHRITWLPISDYIYRQRKPDSFIDYTLFDHPAEGLLIARDFGWSHVYAEVESIEEGKRIIKALFSGEETEDIPDDGQAI